MTTKENEHCLPSFETLVADKAMTVEINDLTRLLHMTPAPDWIEYHKEIDIVNEKGEKSPLPYLPIKRVEWLLWRIFGHWYHEITSVRAVTNGVVVTIRLFVLNPITHQIEHMDGIGGTKGTNVMLDAPSAETYAIKDAAEKYGPIFGRDLTRKDRAGDVSRKVKITHEDLVALYNETVQDANNRGFSAQDLIDIKGILERKDKLSYDKAFKKLSTSNK